MSFFLNKNITSKENFLTSTLVKEFVKSKNVSDKEIHIDTDSNEIAEIISNKLLKKIESKVRI